MKAFPYYGLSMVISLSLFCGNVFAEQQSLGLETIIKTLLKKKTNTNQNIELIYKVKDYYFQILSGQEELDVSEEVRKHFEKAIFKAEEKFSEGDDEVSQSSITKLKLGLSGALNGIVELKSKIAQAKISLEEIIGKDLREDSFHGNHIRPLIFPYLSFDSYVESVVHSNKSMRTNSEMKKAFIRVNESREKMVIAEKLKKITRALLVTEVANHDFGIGDSGDLFEALIIYTRVLRGYYQCIYEFNMAVAVLEKLQP